MTPKGKLVIIGGYEDKGIAGESLDVLKRREHNGNEEILASLISKNPRANHRIEIIATASTIPTEMEKPTAMHTKQ